MIDLTLPKTWATVELGSVVTRLTNGFVGPTRDIYVEAGVPYILSKHVKKNVLRFDGATFVSPEFNQKNKKSILKAGDVLLVQTGHVGESAVVPPEHEGHNCHALIVITPVAEVLDGRYLSWFFASPQTQRVFAGIEKGMTLRHLNCRDVIRLNSPIPPIREQRRIVAKLEALQSRSRRAREALDAVPPLLEKLRQSILAAAFRGDLTKDWRAQNPNPEPASALLSRIRTERRKKWEESELAKLKAKGKPPTNDSWKAKYKEPEPVDTTGLPELPEGWCWASLDEVAHLVTGGTPPGKEANCFGGEVPFFKPTDLDAGRNVIVARQYLTAKGAGFLDMLPPGTVLITCIGATIGKTGLAHVSCATNQQINAARPCLVEADFLYWQVVAPRSQDWIRSNASATTLPILNKGRLAALPVAVAPDLERARICTLLGTLSERWAAAASRTQSGVAELEDLQRSLLAKAFRGELVPQDPSDEPAEVMLSRLRGDAPAESPRPRQRLAKAAE